MPSTVHKRLIKELNGQIPAKQIIKDDLLRYAYGVDASFYSLTPQLVLIVENERETASVVSTCHKLNIPFTFRAAGTSLSGQALTDSVLIKIGPGWNNIRIRDNGSVVTLQPGVTGGEVNRQLLPFNKKLGPDPASANVAKIGGILANNASGMTSGVVYNSYNTLQTMKIVFYDGTILDSGDAQSIEQFSTAHPQIIKGITDLADKVKNNKVLAEKIRAKYKIKNTCGYGLNALVDYSDPIDIIAHLMIGSEGTLGFISEATLKTVANFPYKAATFLIFKNIGDACKTIPLLEKEQVDCAELMDSAALQSIKDLPGIPFDGNILEQGAAALLVEISAENEIVLQQRQGNLLEKLKDLPLLNKADFTTDALERARVWKIRKGLFPTGCKNRAKGTTVIIEDVNFPVEKLDKAVSEVQELLKEYQYSDSFIWGHALAGNIHFVLTQKFDSSEKIENYNTFMQKLAKLVIDRFDGSLKAEHGTGRNMAPFVAYEWGREGYDTMLEIKKIFDPSGIINPGVLLNDDPQIHLKNIKNITEVHEKIDQCTECGFCEKICPSKDFTITPRQRITLFRKELAGTKFNNRVLKKLSRKFKYNVDHTCAADGMCQTECPVDINVGEMIKEVRTMQKSAFNNFLASFIADNFAGVTGFVRIALNAIGILHKVFGERLLLIFSKLLSRISFGRIPEWHPSYPAGASRIIVHPQDNKKDLLYFPACINRMFGSYQKDNSQETLFAITNRVVDKAGFNLKIVNHSETLCCGMAFASKGYQQQSMKMSEKLYHAINSDLKNIDTPVLFDTSPCAIHFQEYIRQNQKDNINIIDPIDFIDAHIRNKLQINRVSEPIALHSVCSVKRNKSADTLSEIAHLCSAKVIQTDPVGCCGFAGDKGIQIPALKKAALNDLPSQLMEECSTGYSTSRMCEIGLTIESGLPFNSVFYLIDKCLD